MRRLELVADCARCAAVCCVATSFETCEDFAFAKAAGERCRHLGPDDRCTIHEELAARGNRGCAIYDCHGAGPRVTRAFPPETRDEAFRIARVLHELLVLLVEAAKLCARREPSLADSIAAEIRRLDAAVEAPDLLETGAEPHEARARELLRRVAACVGAAGGPASRLPPLCGGCR